LSLFKNWISPFLFLLLWGCTAALLPTATAWGESLLIAQARQAAAPALVFDSGGLIAVWIGADERGVHHDVRRVGLDGALGDVLTLPLPPRYPRALQLATGIGGRTHQLWLDADDDGDTQLYGAVLETDFTVFRGPTLVSDAGTYRYHALADGAGGVLAAWSGGLAAEPTLTVTQIDYEGRPVQPLAQLDGADYPVLFRAPDGIYLLWIDVRQQVICLSPFRADLALGCQARVPSVRLERGDWLQGLSAGADRSHIYVLWNIERGQSGDETWFASLPIGGSDWAQPQRLRFMTQTDATVQTGYNSGQVSAARLGGEAVFAFAAPLPTVGDTLPVAGQSGGELGILYFADGSVVGYQAVAQARLLAPPLLLSDVDRHLHMAWSDAVSPDHADLRLVSTR
jgi:hypothetical protein